MELGKHLNRHLVGMQGDKIVIMMPPRGGLTPDEAIGLAAWLCAVAGDIDGERVKKAIASAIGDDE